MKKLMFLLCLLFPLATIAAESVNVDGLYHQIDATHPDFECAIYANADDVKHRYECLTEIDTEIDRFGNAGEFSYLFTLGKVKVHEGTWCVFAHHHDEYWYYSYNNPNIVFKAHWEKNGNIDGLVKIKCTAYCEDNK